jgi:hypothetical protein
MKTSVVALSIAKRVDFFELKTQNYQRLSADQGIAAANNL